MSSRLLALVLAAPAAALLAASGAPLAGQPPRGDTAKSRPARVTKAPAPARRDSATKPARPTPVWPVASAPAPLPGAILPARRIVAYYGNPLSKRMGILGELPPADMLARLDREVAKWNAADPAHPVQPALHLIAVVAQGTPGKDSLYRYRAVPELIEKVYGWAKQKNAILFLDVQIGKSTIEAELAPLVPFLQRPDVHLAIDPEFAMT